MLELNGIIVAQVTPFDSDGNINTKVLIDLTRHQLEIGVNGFLVLGATGEFWALTPEESATIVRTVVTEAKRRAPVLVGNSAEGTEECIRITRMAEELGADGVCTLPPYFNTPLQEEEVFNHFAAIANSTSLPVVLYENPGKCHISLNSRLIGRLARLPNVVGIKDSSGDFTLALEYMLATKGTGFQYLAGRDTLVLSALQFGAPGAVCAQANMIPEALLNVVSAFRAGDLKRAAEEQLKAVRLRMAYSMGSFPSVHKAAVKLLGFDVGNPRPPVAPLSPESVEKLRQLLRDLGAL